MCQALSQLCTPCLSVCLGLQTLTMKWQQWYCEYLKPKPSSAFPFRLLLRVVSGILSSNAANEVWDLHLVLVDKSFPRESKHLQQQLHSCWGPHVRMGKQLWTCWISHPIKHKLDRNSHVTKSFCCIGPLKASVLSAGFSLIFCQAMRWSLPSGASNWSSESLTREGIQGGAGWRLLWVCGAGIAQGFPPWGGGWRLPPPHSSPCPRVGSMGYFGQFGAAQGCTAFIWNQRSEILKG